MSKATGDGLLAPFRHIDVDLAPRRAWSAAPRHTSPRRGRFCGAGSGGSLRDGRAVGSHVGSAVTHRAASGTSSASAATGNRPGSRGLPSRPPREALHDLLMAPRVVRRLGEHVETHRVVAAAHTPHCDEHHGRIEVARDLVGPDVERGVAPEEPASSACARCASASGPRSANSRAGRRPISGARRRTPCAVSAARRSASATATR